MKYKAIRFPTTTEVEEMLQGGCEVIPMRWVDIDKNEKLRIPGGPEVPEKLKSRLVIRGDLEKESFRTDCPTASNTAINILLSYAANKGLELHSGDIAAAFLQGAPIERTLTTSVSTEGRRSGGRRRRHPTDVTLHRSDVGVWIKRRTTRFLARASRRTAKTRPCGSGPGFLCFGSRRIYARSAMLACGRSTI